MRVISSAAYYNYDGSDDKGNLDFRNILEGVVDITDEGGTFIDIMEATGKFVPTTDEDFFSYTNDWLFTTITVTGAGGSGAVAAGTTGTVTVTTNVSSLLKQGDIIHVPATQESVMVVSATNVANSVITFATASDGSGVNIAANAVLAVPYNLIPEGSSSADEPEVDLQRRTNRINIIESSTSASDFRTAAKTVVDLGNGEKGIIYKDQHDLFMKHRGKESFSLLTGKYATFDAADTGFARDVRSSRGLDDYIVNYGGNVHTATNAASAGIFGGFDEADWATYSRKLDKARAPKEGMLMTGGAFGVDWDNLWKDDIKQSGINFSMFGKGNGKQRAIDLGVSSVHIFDRTYHKFAAATLDHQYVTSTTGSIYDKAAYFIPAGKIKAGGKMVDRMRVRYLNLGQYGGGRLLEKRLGGLNPTQATSRDNKIEWSYTSYIGLEVNGTQHFGRFLTA